jgi:hypothetical protein
LNPERQCPKPYVLNLEHGSRVPREYDEMTKDVTGMRRGAGVKMSGLTRDLGFGAHVLTVMAACFVGGMVAGRV